VKRGISTLKRRQFVVEAIKNPQISDVAKRMGMTKQRADQLIHLPSIREAVDRGISEAAKAAGVSRQWVIEKLRDVAVRCMQGEPVRDKEGNETGQWKFDSGGANRALELIGKHLRLFDDDLGATAQLGTAVIRVLAQQAQARRMRVPSITVEGEPNTSLPPSVPPSVNNPVTVPPHVEI
jgi:phage terminase small subunit